MQIASWPTVRRLWIQNWKENESDFKTTSYRWLEGLKEGDYNQF